MSHEEQFLSSFSPLPEGVVLPPRVLLAYEPESCLANAEDKLILRLRCRADGTTFILKRGPWADLEPEFHTLSHLAMVLPKSVPQPADCFQEDGMGYLIRSYLPGETLAQYRDRMGTVSPGVCADVGQKLCGLVQTLHSQKPPVIHRDIKPENVILLPDGSLGLIDFGTARQYAPGQDADTRHLGTCTTAAPEQYGYAQTDERTDVYAIGATLLWLAAGTYDRSGLDMLPRWLGRALEKAMAFDPKDRWPSASALRDALARKISWKKAALGATAALCAVLALWAALSNGTARQPKPGDTVAFSSHVLEAAVREELELPEGPVTYGDLERVERLAAMGQAIFRREQSFDCRLDIFIDEVQQQEPPKGDVADLSLLSWMPNLRELYLCHQNIEDVFPLSALPLTTLALHGNEITDVSPLGAIDTLEALYVGENPAADYSALSGLSHLRLLNLDRPVEGFTFDNFAFLEPLELEELSLGRVEPKDGDWSPLAGMESLFMLHLWDAPAEALTAVRQLPNLDCLTAGGWRAGDLTLLSGMEQLVSLNIYGGLESFAGAEGLPGLEILFVSGGTVSDLSPLANLPLLRSVSLYDVPVTDFFPLSKVKTLEELHIDQSLAAVARAALPGIIIS